MKHRLTLLFTLCFLLLLPSAAQERADSDSIIKDLQSQLHEHQLREIMMREQLSRTDANNRRDSLQLARRKASIDSLRSITAGAPLVIDGDTLLKLYARKGGMTPDLRIESAEKIINERGKSLTFFSDSCYVFEGEYFSDIMIGEDVILSISLEDALWENTTRQELANKYCKIIEAKVKELHADYGLQQKILGILFIVLILAGQWFAYRLTKWLYMRWRLRLTRLLLKKAKPISIKDYEFLNMHQIGVASLVTFRIIFIFIIILQLLVSIPLLFSAFPETKDFAYTIYGYIVDPIKDIFDAIVGFLPNLIKIIIIVVCFHYLVKGIKYFTNEIAAGKLKINGFYADWAHPTFVIVRVLCYSFMFVMIWPLLPSSNSEVFQGVSVFIGIIVSLGSSSIIGNVMAGMVMTYMRPFRIGDFIKYGDTEGFVIEKTVLVTRIRTRKNDVITIPNSNLLTSQTSNYTVAAHDYGIIVHTKVTIGYDMNWQFIRQLLIEAAEATHGIVHNPKPFVVITALDDFYVEYEINAYTHKAETLSIVYSELRQNILDKFHTSGVEIMSPHIYAHRNDLELQIPKDQQHTE
ncbi:mechanosensitive ion channel family protein [Prevotella sp. E13-27]|uniref:mechanosensitive ion channel family protein n=1 Tax=Prevotella sp. E13-27 TaxID=2938122 RepID=UPI00200B803D|nr:mechanosensitive ion channel domain-containing protein [Prevotella sp. E13-27]MCK8622687.1 mechanosensitive ion channel family protein [Prevotella sp. E13-27]